MRFDETSDSIEYKQKHIKKMKKARKKRRIKFFRNLIVLILFVVAVIALAMSPLFSIDRIEVYGSKHYTDDELIDASGLIKGSNWFRTEDNFLKDNDLKDILLFRSTVAQKNILKRCPYVKSVVVRLKTPRRVGITVTEREPAALVPYKGTNLVIDSEGWVLDAHNNAEDYSLPEIKGLNIISYEMGQALITENPDWLETYNKVMNIIKRTENNSDDDGNIVTANVNKLSKDIKYVDFSKEGNIYINLDSRITVNLGDINDLSDYKVIFLREIYFEHLANSDRGYLDFTSEDRPSFIPE